MRRAICLILVLAVFAIAFSSCSQKEKVAEETIFAMDTPIFIRLYTDEETAAPHFKRCREIISDIEKTVSRTVAGSDVSRINSSEALTENVGTATSELISLSLDVYEKTGGAFDIGLANLADLWQSAGERNSLPTEAELLATLENCGANNISCDKSSIIKSKSGVKLDLGGIGKGYAIEKVIGYLKSTDIPGGLVSFGSNVATFGKKPDSAAFRVSLRDPFDANGTVGVFTMDDKILSVSGDYERYVEIGGERYHHILDPKNGYPTDNGIHSVAVLCSDGALADALSTALFVMGLDGSLEFYDSGVYAFEAVFVTDDGIFSTPGLDGVFEK